MNKERAIDYFSELEVAKYERSLEALKEKYTLKSTNDLRFEKLDALISSFKKTTQYKDAYMLDAWHISAGTKKIIFGVIGVVSESCDIGAMYLPGKSIHRDAYPVIIVQLKEDFGRVQIRPETLTDKISELFEKKELDFDEHKRFSWRYYFLADDEEKARAAVTRKFLDNIDQHKGLLLYIEGNGLLATKYRAINTGDVLELAEFGFSLAGD